MHSTFRLIMYPLRWKSVTVWLRQYFRGHDPSLISDNFSYFVLDPTPSFLQYFPFLVLSAAFGSSSCPSDLIQRQLRSDQDCELARWPGLRALQPQPLFWHTGAFAKQKFLTGTHCSVRSSPCFVGLLLAFFCKNGFLAATWDHALGDLSQLKCVLWCQVTRQVPVLPDFLLSLYEVTFKYCSSDMDSFLALILHFLSASHPVS